MVPSSMLPALNRAAAMKTAAAEATSESMAVNRSGLDCGDRRPAGQVHIV